MTKETKEYKPLEEWLIWMDAFNKDNSEGKMRAINYLLIQIIDCTFENKASLKRLENTLSIGDREIQIAKRGWIV